MERNMNGIILVTNNYVIINNKRRTKKTNSQFSKWTLQMNCRFIEIWWSTKIGRIFGTPVYGYPWRYGDNTQAGTTSAASRSQIKTIHLRRDTLGQGPPFHGRLVLHVLDLLLQCVLVHGGEYTGIHGDSRTPLVANGNEMALAPLTWKINKNVGVYRVFSL